MRTIHTGTLSPELLAAVTRARVSRAIAAAERAATRAILEPRPAQLSLPLLPSLPPDILAFIGGWHSLPYTSQEIHACAVGLYGEDRAPSLEEIGLILGTIGALSRRRKTSRH